MKCDYCGSLSHEQPECPILVSQSERAMSKATGPLPVVAAVTGGWGCARPAKPNLRNIETDADDHDRTASLEAGDKPCAGCEAPELSHLSRQHWNLCPICAGEQTV